MTMNDDSIIIPRADLPEVALGSSGERWDVDGIVIKRGYSANDARDYARAYLALAEHLDAQKPRPLAVGDRVRVVRPEYASGSRVGALAVGDVGEVVEEADMDGDIGFRRDGASSSLGIAAANVERIEDVKIASLDTSKIRDVEGELDELHSRVGFLEIHLDSIEDTK